MWQWWVIYNYWLKEGWCSFVCVAYLCENIHVHVWVHILLHTLHVYGDSKSIWSVFLSHLLLYFVNTESFTEPGANQFNKKGQAASSRGLKVSMPIPKVRDYIYQHTCLLAWSLKIQTRIFMLVMANTQWRCLSCPWVQILMVTFMHFHALNPVYNSCQSQMCSTSF